MILEWIKQATYGDIFLIFMSIMTVVVCIALGIAELVDYYQEKKDRDDWLDGKQL